ncbi:Uncharacterized conserved protein, DUF1501 family [Quadrisphaera sp. DSM 44207]|nr:Uncharacterized conserved protein, DUF1501 family [Quadrisphaera sp. DSM 44207]
MPATTLPCTCPDGGPGGGPGGGLTRRTLLKALGGAALTLAATEAVHTRVALAAPGYTGDVLVVLSLRGGFDGLSAIVPGGDPDYRRLRPTIGIPASALLPLDSTFGLHPALAPLLPLWRAGTLGAVQGVGQPDPTRSHFKAMEEMERAAPGSGLRTGWLDRTLGTRAPETPLAAVSLGSPTTPASLVGPSQELTVGSLDGFALAGPWSAAEHARWTTALTELHREGPPTVAAAGARALEAARTIAGTSAAPGAAYPAGDLGTCLRDVARLVKADVGVQVAAVDYGDWDMHNDLGRHDRGWMRDKLAELASALAAFAADLGPRMSGVTLLTLSEFGRRAGENGSGGLDHGHGNLVLMMGGGVVGGRVHGRWPGLSTTALDDGALAGTTDFRGIVGEVLQKRCGAGSLGDVFPGFSGGTGLGLVRAR